ncbi:hypothetical protein SLE2022_367670 [Rubroshorea leprosula]
MPSPIPSYVVRPERKEKPPSVEERTIVAAGLLEEKGTRGRVDITADREHNKRCCCYRRRRQPRVEKIGRNVIGWSEKGAKVKKIRKDYSKIIVIM